ncbi:exonuclease 3'-5' domain-containing protein 2 [Diachasma alloeum]|uniref:exonuclease 3'-5' domain-containing protein 2 n=1 Tax=Diachasma alloeum TaxID=454923 RepID=UPI0007382421|nr:exonuclease 3'-5' domain-containing protein 2 [Diachasma alloeum]
MFRHSVLKAIRVLLNVLSLSFCLSASSIYLLSIKILNMIFVCVTAGLLYLASKYRDNVLRSVKNICHSITSPHDDEDTKNNKKCVLPLSKIILADSPEKCDYAVQRIRRNLCHGVLGFDCEWVNEGRVSLLQLATYNGVCALFRLGKIGYVPPKLKELLSNDCILKVGVAPFEDGRKLTNDYGCRVFGTVDLRTLADGLGIPSRKSLAAMCMQYLGVELEKIIEVRCGDWDAETLTDEQMFYAAYDAVASVLIYREMQRTVKRKRSPLRNLLLYLKSLYHRRYHQAPPYNHEVPPDLVDIKYRGTPEPSAPEANNNNNLTKNKNSPPPNPQKISSIPTRKEPLYHNCYLQAPDGETLCTCDRKKAEWYVTKGLGVTVNESPLTVRLNFEPSGRALGQVGQYYTQVKVNQCVVCGGQDKFIKKNVVPREYRKYFPLVMKAHQSHDVLLLCPTCHEISNRHDLDLRRHLASVCNAPLSRSLPPSRADASHHKRRLMSAVKALRDPSAPLPPHRRQELEARVLEYTSPNYSILQCDPEASVHVSDGMEFTGPVSSSPLQARVTPHGLKVVEYFTNSQNGLVALERMWREHFLTTMRPKFLPKLWSVRHNQERLEIRQTQNRIEPQDAKVAGLAR